ncbi:MAG: DegT/DnrJ/EryC1/StrS family aminotransferase [Candidatus Omnitrophota bacterium]
MKIPILNLKAQYAEFEKETLARVKAIMREQDFVLGQEVRTLEAGIAKYCGTKYAVGVASGTDALILSLKAMGIGPGDEVITTPFTFMATAEAIALVGATPVFAEIDRATYNIDPARIEEKITPRTKAILPVHIYGLCVDMDPVLEIAKKRRLKVLEDAAQAIGSEYKGRRAGSMGDAGAISFFPSKNLGAFGDAGMVVTNDPKICESLKLLRVHGSDRRYYHDVIGYNSRLDNLQAAVLNIKLKRLEGWIKERIAIARYFDKKFKALPLKTPYVPDGYRHSYYLYVLRGADKDGIERSLIDSGIETRTYYPVPLHLQKCFSYLGYKEGAFPEAESACRETFAVPLYPELTGKEKEYITGKIAGFFRD